MLMTREKKPDDVIDRVGRTSSLSGQRKRGAGRRIRPEVLQPADLHEAGHGLPEMVSIDERFKWLSPFQGQGGDSRIGPRLVEEGKGEAFAVVGEDAVLCRPDPAAGPPLEEGAEVDHQRALAGGNVVPLPVGQARLQPAHSMLLKERDEA